jgi:hypothetical protein
MVMGEEPGRRKARRRRAPADGRDEILAAAEAALGDYEWRELTVARVMARTTLARSASRSRTPPLLLAGARRGPPSGGELLRRQCVAGRSVSMRADPLRSTVGGMRVWGVAVSCACALVLALPGAALAGWGAAETVGNSINQVLLAPGGPGFLVGFPAESPARLRFALRPLAGPVGLPMEFPAGVGQGELPAWGFDAAGDAVVVDAEAKMVYWRSANGETGPVQIPGGALLGRSPRLVSVDPVSGVALVGFNATKSAVQLAFRTAGPKGEVNTKSVVNLTTLGTLVGLRLQPDGGAVAVYWDEKAEPAVLMQVIRLAGEEKFEAPTEIKSSGDPAKHEVSFASDPSGWAMVGWSGSSTKGGPFNQALATVRAPGGTFPVATVLATGMSVSNVSPAVTSAGDGLAAWSDTGFGACIYKEGVINGATEHLGTWSAPKALGPGAWPDISTPAYGSTAFAAGTDVSVPMTRIHREGTPCPAGATQTRALIVHHYRSGAAGLIDEGTSELAPLGSSEPLQVNGWAMEPSGRILAWYRAGTQAFVRAFDGVLPVAGAPPSTETISTPAPGGTSTPTPTVHPSIKPLVLQEFAIVPTLTPKQLEFEMQCPHPIVEENGEVGEDCSVQAYGMFLFTGKQIKAYGARAKPVKKRLDVIATGATTIKAGHRGRVKLHLNRLGRALLKSGAKLKFTLRITVKLGHRSFTGSLPATIKAARHH